MNDIVKQTGEIEIVDADVNAWPENDKEALLDYIMKSHSSPSRMTQDQYRCALSEIVFEGKRPIDKKLGNLVGIKLLYKVSVSGKRNVPSNVGSFHLSFTTDSCIITTRKKDSIAPEIASAKDRIATYINDAVTQGRIPNWLALEQRSIAPILKKTFAASLSRNLQKFLNGVLGPKYEKNSPMHYFDQIMNFVIRMIGHINGGFNENFIIGNLQEIRLSDDYLCTFQFKGSTKMYHLPNKLGRIIQEEIPTS